jgi:glycosyltransferase involved in cell wall biosynthesis
MTYEEFKTKYQKEPFDEYPNRVLDVVPCPVLTVQVSTYQHGPFIRQCLDGILMQETDFPWEICIGEDESSDGTREICIEYAEKYPDKVRLFLHKRANNIPLSGNPSGKFQVVWTRQQCRGRYVAFCEGDDYWTDPLKLQKQVTYLEEHPNVVLTFHDVNCVDEVGNQLHSSKMKLKGAGSSDYKLRSYKEIKRKGTMPTLSIVYRNVPFEIFENTLKIKNGDTYLYAMLAQYGEMHALPGIMGTYRMHSGGIWTGTLASQQGIDNLNTLIVIAENISMEYFRESLKSVFRSLVIAFMSRIYRREFNNIIFFLKKYISGLGLLGRYLATGPLGVFVYAFSLFYFALFFPLFVVITEVASFVSRCFGRWSLAGKLKVD